MEHNKSYVGSGFKIMGNGGIYRLSPRRIFNSTSGSFPQFKFAANQITGWRNSQEDRYVCLPNVGQDFSLFAVYDGHGGEEVVQYLERFLHQFISRELELTKDVELALYLSFLNCDSSLRNISDVEYALIENDLVKEFEVPDKAERRRVLFGSIDAAGTSGENQNQDDFRAAIVGACIKELPSISYLTQAPVQESETDDSEYEPGDEDINFFTDENSDQTVDSSESCSPDSFDDDSMSAPDKEDKTEINNASTPLEDTGCSSREDQTENIEQNVTVMKTNEDTKSTVKEANKKRKKQECTQQEDFGRQIGFNCGSTATVLLINTTKVFIAHVGDSRCVACIKGQAIDLCTDHRPKDNEEYNRIINAGGYVSEDGRIEGDIDMSRAFGDFCYKPIDDPFQMLSVEPSVSSIEISPDLEFIIVASDGIWNTMDSANIVDYIQKRSLETEFELQDLCGELFEELLPEKLTADGSGCDNMTAIIIKFNSTQRLSKINYLYYQEIYEYRYPPKSDNSSTNNETDNSSTNNQTDNSSTKNKSDNSSTAENSKNYKEKHEVTFQCDIIRETECIGVSESSGKSKKGHKTGFSKKRANCEINDKRKFDRSSSERRDSSENHKRNFDCVDRISTHHKQELYRLNRNRGDPAIIMTAQSDNKKMKPSKSKENSLQLDKKDCNSNFPQNCCNKSRSSDQISPFQRANNMANNVQISPLQRANNMANNDQISPLQLENNMVNIDQANEQEVVEHRRRMIPLVLSINRAESSIRKLEGTVSNIKAQVSAEMRRFGCKYQFSHPTNSTSTVTQSPIGMEVDIVDLTNEELPSSEIPTSKQSDEQDDISKVDSASMQSPLMHIETDFVKVTNKRIQNPEQSVEKDDIVDYRVMQSPTMQMGKEVEIPEQSVGQEIMPQITAVKSLNSEQSVVQDAAGKTYTREIKLVEFVDLTQENDIEMIGEYSANNEKPVLEDGVDSQSIDSAETDSDDCTNEESQTSDDCTNKESQPSDGCDCTNEESKASDDCDCTNEESKNSDDCDCTNEERKTSD